MSKEEKQAIKIVNSLKEWGKTHFLVKDNSYARLSYNEVYVLLNFVTRLQDERNRLKLYIKENKIYKKRLFEYAEKKDKQISLVIKENDSMVKWINEHIRYYDEDGCYCEIEKDICKKDIDCKECIKSHFKEKDND